MLRDVWKNYLVDGGSYFRVAFCSCFEIYAGGGMDTGGWNACMLNILCKNVEGGRGEVLSLAESGPYLAFLQLPDFIQAFYFIK